MWVAYSGENEGKGVCVGESCCCCVIAGCLNAALHGLLLQVLDELEEAMQGPLGLDALCGTRKLGTLARPRRLEMAAALNRLRSATFHQRRSS